MNWSRTGRTPLASDLSAAVTVALAGLAWRARSLAGLATVLLGLAGCAGPARLSPPQAIPLLHDLGGTAERQSLQEAVEASDFPSAAQAGLD